MWLRKDELNSELKEDEILDEVEINGTLWIEIADEKGVEYVQSKNRATIDKKVIFAQDEFCESGGE